MTLSNSQIDKLGQRLRNGSKETNDFALLEEFRNGLDEHEKGGYACVKRVKNNYGMAALLTKRRSTTRQSIMDKLVREQNLRLSQMQDVEG